MKTSRQFWRGLFFIFLITALCGGLVLPAVENAPARAAPKMQATACTGTTIAQWDFTGNVTTPSVGTGTFSIGPGLPDPTFAAGSPGRAVTFDTWTAALDSTKYIDLAVPTVGRDTIGMSFDYRSTSAGPATVELHYSIDGVNFAVLSSQPLNRDSNFHSLSFDFSTVTGLNDNTNAVFRLYGYGATNAGGTLRLDNITVSDCLTPIELTGTAVSDITNTAVAANSTGTAAAITSTAAAANSTGTVAAVTGTASAVNATATAAALTNPSTPTATNTSPATAASVVISEFRTRGEDGANDEFIELYNPTTGIIDISGWKINASNDTGGTSTRATIPASTILRSGQYYLVANNAANNGYNNPSVPPNLIYGTGIADDGGIALLRADNTIVDQVGMDAGSAYKEGTILSPLTADADQSYKRKPENSNDGCQDTNNNANDFYRTASNPQNYASQLSRCGTLLNIPVVTVTTITSDTPDPSLTNSNVTVSVRVTGGSPLPSGTVNITGANTNCTLTLNASGTGSCTVRFTTAGSKTLTATYIGDQTHLASTDTEPHQVSTTIRTPTPTRVPTLPPPPPLLVINEFVPRPGHDWNLDGIINTDDEYIEILNHGVIDVNLNGYSLDDEINIGSAPYRLPSVTLKPGERRVFYGSETGLLLSDGGDGVRLLRPNGQLMDAYNYRVVRLPDQTYCRLPDNGGADDWNQNCFPTPGLQNSLSGSAVNPPTSGGAENLCPIADTLPNDFVYAECPPFGNNIWNPAYWDRFGWYNEKNLPESPGKWPIFVD